MNEKGDFNDWMEIEACCICSRMIAAQDFVKRTFILSKLSRRKLRPMSLLAQACEGSACKGELG